MQVAGQAGVGGCPLHPVSRGQQWEKQGEPFQLRATGVLLKPVCKLGCGMFEDYTELAQKDLAQASGLMPSVSQGLGSLPALLRAAEGSSCLLSEGCACVQGP